MRYMLTGAAIAVVCGALGVAGGAWMMKGTATGPKFEVRNPGLMAAGKPGPMSLQPANFNGQPPAINGASSVFNGQKLQANPALAVPPAKPVFSYDQFQKVQGVPEVKAAREAFMEAQKKFSETFKMSMANGQGVAAGAAQPPAAGASPAMSILSYDQFQKVQDVPEVKAAREAFLEAQKKFADSVKKAVVNGPGMAAHASPTAPVMLQASPATGSSTNSAAKARL